MNKRDILLIINKTINITKEYVSDLSSVKNQKRYLFLLGQYLTFLELLIDLELLVKHNRHRTMPLIARSLFEIQVDMIWCLRNGLNVRNLALQATIDEIKSLNASLKQTFFNSNQIEFLKKRKQECEEKERLLEHQNAKQYNLKGKCKEINLTNRYEFEYSVLCKDVHNNLEMIERRHIRENNHGYSLIYGENDWNYSRHVIASIFNTIQEVFKNTECAINCDNTISKEIENMMVLALEQ